VEAARACEASTATDGSPGMSPRQRPQLRAPSRRTASSASTSTRPPPAGLTVGRMGYDPASTKWPLLPHEGEIMDRRDFVAASLGAALAPSMSAAPAEGATTGEGPTLARPQLLELRRYQFRFGPMEARFAEYAKGALIPALNRAGVKPVGAFSVVFGGDTPAAYLLLPHAGPDSVSGL